MGRPKKENKKKRNSFTLSEKAQVKVDAIPQNKSKVVSKLIEDNL